MYLFGIYNFKEFIKLLDNLNNLKKRISIAYEPDYDSAELWQVFWYLASLVMKSSDHYDPIDDVIVQLSDEECLGEKPGDEEPCIDDGCPTWYTGQWSGVSTVTLIIK